MGGWYLGPSPEHYRCYRVYITKTRAERDSNTVEFLPQHTTIPFQTPTDVVIKATQDILKVLHNPTPTQPYKPVGQEQLEAIEQLQEIYTGK